MYKRCLSRPGPTSHCLLHWLSPGQNIGVYTGISLTHSLLIVDDIVGFSGDFGSGVGWEDEEEKETEEAGEEAEEEEGEAGEADDGGYIW